MAWKDDLQKNLIEKYGRKVGIRLSKKYKDAFPPGYINDNSVDIATDDIKFIAKLSEDNPLGVCLYYQREKKEKVLHLRLFQWKASIPLSDILPILENLNLRTENEHPYKLMEKQTVWISDFVVEYKKDDLAVDTFNELFQEAFIKIYFGVSENDGFNKLVLGAALSWREIIILRTYAKYLRQVGFRFTQPYIETTLINNANITKDLIQFFITLNDPSKEGQQNTSATKIEERILQALKFVPSLDEDIIIRRMLDLIKATLRTNYFQKDPYGKPKEYLSVKLNSHEIPELPLPLPLFEIFIYSPRFEGIHLRNTKVARGGIRWSDRPEDFRTEILGLMKAQVVKNAVIVPSGAKGGFVLKTVPAYAAREEKEAEVIHCYKAFINGLLDITDNIRNKKFVRPIDVVCHDDPDPYLVVAADKGTATFSDIANSISKQCQFWLGDAFASGGSTGYDHKKMGITAKGTWESIKRHLRELDINIENFDITVVGIGDMSGDVFGNGMIYSKHIKLVAAFDHRNIFIDPNPDPEISYYERVRMFNLPASTWEDYNPKLISKGGGVFRRSLKEISITPQMKKVLGILEDDLNPNELIRALLKAPVTLLYNGGIGTFVKSSNEDSFEVGDRTNDYSRVDGIDLRCKVVGEGGNLGFTQLGRIEYALNGGLINTDFIDNSAGVDCSDHEVNLKILLNSEVHKKKLTEEKRNKLLAAMTDEVAALVLEDNYSQSLMMSYSAFYARREVIFYSNYIQDLENEGVINGRVEFLPDNKILLERKAAGVGLTRPELAVLLDYTKIYIKHAILESALPEDNYLKQILETSFPMWVRKKYHKELQDHLLKRDIIATQLSNYIVNEMGIIFVYRLQMETGATVEEIVRAHAVSSQIYNTSNLQKLVVSLDFKLPMSEQYEMLHNIRHLIKLSTRWFLQNGRIKGSLQTLIEHFSKRISVLEKLIPELMGGYTKQYLESITDKFLKAGLSLDSARKIATSRAIYTSLNIIEVATVNNFDLIKTAKVYFSGGERMNLVWFRDQIANDIREGHWIALARLTLRDEFDIAQRALTVAIMQNDKKDISTDKLITQWVHNNKRAVERWEKFLGLIHGSPQIDYTMFFIAIRELMRLINVSIAYKN